MARSDERFVNADRVQERRVLEGYRCDGDARDPGPRCSASGRSCAWSCAVSLVGVVLLYMSG